MTPAARIQAAIDVLDRWRAASEGVDRVLAAWGRANRYAGSGDRRAIGDLVYDALRRLRSSAWGAGAGDPPTGRDLLLGSLLLDERDPGDFFTGLGYAPAPLTEVESNRLGQPLAAAPRAVRLDIPDWLAPRLSGVSGATLDLMRRRAPLHLRVNLLRSDVSRAIAALAQDQICAEPGPLSPTCLTVESGVNAVAHSAAYREGLVEIQDASSQVAADYSRAQPGETILDYCAGGGGKTLALAAATGNNSHIHAHDISESRLAQLPDRAERARALISLLAPGRMAELDGRCDLVFVDAPCTGSGAWRRNPDAKWRLTEAALAAYLETQDSVLASAARAVKPGGRLVYATCSILTDENQDRVAAFLSAHPEFHPGRPPLSLTPIDGGDGFFACELLRSAE
jgi:16S rRNA (cytosine967-C5)-methyltransferase